MAAGTSRVAPAGALAGAGHTPAPASPPDLRACTLNSTPRNTAYIGLGSNLGDPLSQLRRAASALARVPESAAGRCSRVYRSVAVGPGNQPDYLNAVLELTTSLAPLSLLDQLQAIEQRQGRVRSVRWGPRTLDLDLLLYGDEILNHARLSIPHPQLHRRNFVLYPLTEIADPKMLLPGGTELGTLVAACPRDGLTVTELTLAED